MDIICKYEDCTGCQACVTICPKSAISMRENEKGHLYPIVNTEMCIDCSKCTKVCPSLNPLNLSKAPLVTYAAHIKDETNRLYSTSGGVSFAISKYIVENEGYFCGVIWDKNCAKHRIASNIQDLKCFQGSKYAHSDVGPVYKDIKKLLVAGKKVAFSGTPCQCAGLKNFLNKDYENLYLIDIICHGVPSRKFMRDCINHIEKTTDKIVETVRFKDKRPDQYNTNMVYKYRDGGGYSQSFKKSFFSRLFDDNYILRDNCYRCQYASINRVSDITLADFWGYLPHNIRFHDYRKGMSIVIVNSEKGQLLFDEVSYLLSFEKRSYEENLNPNLKTPQKKPYDWNNFWDDYLSGVSIEELKCKYLHEQIDSTNSYKRKLKEWACMLMPERLFNLLLKFTNK